MTKPIHESVNKPYYSKEELNTAIAEMDSEHLRDQKRTVVFDLVPINLQKIENSGLVILSFAMWSTLHKIVYVSSQAESRRVEIEATLKIADAPTPCVNLAGLFPSRLVLRPDDRPADEFDKIRALREYGVEIDDILMVVSDTDYEWSRLKCNCFKLSY